MTIVALVLLLFLATPGPASTGLGSSAPNLVPLAAARAGESSHQGLANQLLAVLREDVCSRLWLDPCI